MLEISVGRAVVARMLVVGMLAIAVLALAGVSRASALPAGWGYELISQPDSLGNDINFGLGAPDGNHAWVSVLIPASADQSTGNVLVYSARRTTTGWVLQDLGTPGSSDRHVLSAYAADGTRTLTSSCDNILIGCLEGRFGFERVDQDNNRHTMLDIPYHYPDLEPMVMGTSDDLSRIIFRTAPGSAPLSADDTHTSGWGLYASNNGVIEYLGKDENGQVIPCGAVLGGDQVNINNGNGNGFEQSGLSADGRTLAFEGPDPDAGCPDPVDVYVRRDGVSVDISRPQSGPDDGAQFAGASRDGTITYFTTTNQLVSTDTDTNPDIYVYDSTTHTTERITTGVGAVPHHVAVSPDGGTVYFESDNAFNGQGTNGLPNLYMYRAGSIRFLATATTAGSLLIGSSIRSERASYITPDGTSLLFMSSDPLTSGQPTGGLVEIFQYNATRDVMTCVSCPPDGSLPTAETRLSGIAPFGNVNQHHQSDDGNSVAFETRQSLLPDDANATANAANGDGTDVYLWRRGQPLALISSGRSEVLSTFDTISADGHNVFFEANDRLVPGVEQDNKKLYVARLGGGFPIGTPTPRCAEDSCQGLLTPPSPFAPPASETLTTTSTKKQTANKATHIAIVKINAAQRQKLINTGQMPVAFRTDDTGTLALGMAARLFGGWVRTDHTTHTIHTPGRGRVSLHLSHKARTYLSTHTTMRVRITARQGRTTTRNKILLRDN